ncbi:MAG: DUF2341 domain-containing protein [Chloroflexi bacterium]|nr:DUF2341 domain-containing protein [Chloroflexota bacterium]
MKRLLPKQKKSKKKKKGSGGTDIGRRLGGKSVAQVTRLIPAPVRKKLLGLSSGVRIAAGLAAVLLFLGLTAAVISGVEFAPNLAAGAIFIPIFAFLATERRRMAARLISVIVSLMLALALLSSQVGVVSAAPGSLYLYDTLKSGAAPAGETMDDSVGSSAASLTFDTAGQNAYWYTDLSYPTGGDDASSAAGDYLLEMYFSSLPSAAGWWDTAYGYRQQITVTAGTTAVPSGYSTLLTFDHAQLVTDGKALSSGDDLRVLFWNGGSFVELDRALDDGSSWDSATTDIWIQTQASIAASGTDTNYWIYYGNSGATGPPANKSNIFLFWDDFESETIGSVPSAWTEVTSTDDWSVQVDPTDGTNKLLRARNVSNNYVYTTSNLGAYNTELQARILSQSAGANDNPSVALSHRYNPGEPQSYRARQRTTGVGEFHIWKRSGNCTLASSAFTFPADTWVIQRARATDNGANVDLDFRTWEEATPATFAQVNATDVANACGIGESVNQAYEKIGIYASESLEDLFFDDVRVRLYVSPEPTTPLSTEELLPSVDITVGVYHTKTDGTIPQLITSASTRIDPNTVDGLVINLGSGAAQTYTQADPQLLRVLITVDAANNGGSFDLAYGIAADPTNIETPSLTVLDPVLLLALFAILIPILTAIITQKRNLATRMASLVLSLLLAIALLSTQVEVVTAAPDAFYLHANTLNDGQDLSNMTGAGPTSSTTFNSEAQSARWYTTLTYPAGTDDSTLDAGTYTFNMYFQQLPGSGWWDTNYGFRKQITVSTGTEGIGPGYSASLTFDHAALVTGGKADFTGDDFRVVHYDGFTFTELDRVLDPFSGWDTGNTKIWFPLVDLISATSSDNQYWIYYGYPLALGPPAEMATVFLVGDDFEDGALTIELTPSTSGAVSISEIFGEALIEGGSVGSDAGILVDENFVRQIAIQNIIRLEGGSGESTLFGIVEDATIPTVTDTATEDARRRIMITHDADTGDAYMFYTEATTLTQIYWDGIQWTSTFSSFDNWAVNVYHWIEFFGDGTDWWIDIRSEGGTLLDQTDTVAWTSVEDGGDDFWYYWGDPYTDQNWVTFLRSQWLTIREYVNPEPGIAFGTEQTPPSVDITVNVHSTEADGSNPQLVISNSTTIDPNTANPFIFNLGSTVSATNFSSSNPQRLRVEVIVDSINLSGDFILDYDSPTQLTRLETPSLTVLDPALVLAVAAIFIPIITALATERRRIATRLISVLISLMLAVGLLSTQVGIVSAGPDSLYFYDTSKVGPAPAGETMDNSVGSSAASLTFDTGGQNAYWYTDLSYPTGGDDASIVAGDYLLEMYFNSLPSAASWWDTAYGYKQQITVTAGSTSVPSGYSTLLTFNHAALVAAGKALSSGDDLRVVFWDGGSFMQLDRALDDGSSWDNASTSIWIQSQAAIAASGTDTNYWIYYGNSGATGPPANKSNIFLFWDDFESETIGSVPSAWTEVTPTDDWSVQVDPTDGTNKLLRARNVSNNYVFTTSNLGAYNTELQARILSQSAGANDNPSVALSHRYNPGEPQSYRARQRTTGVGEFHIWKRSGNCTLASSAFTFPADTWVIQRARATDNGANVDLDFRTWEEATPATFAQVNATDVANACGIGESVNQAYEKIGIYASESLEDLFFDDVRVRLYVSPEPTTPLSTEELLPSVDITVGVYHTKTDGTIPQLITSASTRIDPNTVDGLVLNLGSGAAQTYTQADPQLLRVLITVDAANNGGSFDLAYDSAADPTNLETPSLTVLDPVLLLALFAILIPILTAIITQKRNLATRMASLVLSLLLAIGLLSTQVEVVTAAPNVFYLHDALLNDGFMMNQAQGIGFGEAVIFDIEGDFGQTQWAVELVYVLGGLFDYCEFSVAARACGVQQSCHDGLQNVLDSVHQLKMGVMDLISPYDIPNPLLSRAAS